MKLREWRGPEQKGLVLLGQRCCLVTNWYLRRWSHGAGTQTSKGLQPTGTGISQKSGSGKWENYNLKSIWMNHLNEFQWTIWMNCHCHGEKPFMWWWQAQKYQVSALLQSHCFTLSPNWQRIRGNQLAKEKCSLVKVPAPESKNR